ncbi:MAG: hypothetical protein HRU23_19070 [Gammaproteobacteria bacterium]|nr:hypothetical protein [Gammaproteobacteria bacterium]
MDKDLAKMLANAKANPRSQGPFPLVEHANAINQDNSLNIETKVERIQALERQATDYEQDAFAEVWESLYVTATDNELIYLSGLDS